MATTRLAGQLIRSGSIPATALGGGVISASAQLATSLPTGTVSSSAQIDYNSITNKLSGIVSSSAQVTPLLPGSTVSSSAQVDITATTNYSTFSSSLATVDATQQVSLTALNAATSSYAINSTLQGQLAGVVSSSTQVPPLLPGGTVSASGQVDITTTTGYSTFSSSLATVDATQQVSLTALNTATSSYAINSTLQSQLAGVVSSSTQVKPLLPGGTVSSSVQVDYNSITNKLSDIVSSSAQFNALSGTSASFATTASFALTSAGGGGSGGGGVFVTASDPTLTINPTTTGSLWLNSSSGQLFVNSDRTSNANEWLNLSTGSNVAPGNTFYSFVTASVQKIVSGTIVPLSLQLKDRFNKALNINTGQSAAITGSDGAYTSTIYSASGIFTASVTGPNKVTGSFTVSGSIGGTLLTPITFTIVDPLSLNALGGGLNPISSAIPTSSGYNGHSRQLNGKGGPQLVSALTTWESASTNGSNVLATTFDGILYAWGDTGSLFGTGSSNTLGGGSRTPTRVGTGSFSSSVWVQHSIGNAHAAAIRNDGTLWTWGSSVSGALGLGGAILTASAPTRVGTDSDWVTVSCGNDMTLALKSDTTLWATGNNNKGQLGLGISGSADTNRSVFTKVIGENWSPRIFAAADRTSYAIKNNGTLFGWGFNALGLIGNGVSNLLPVVIPTQEATGLTDWVTVIPSRGNSDFTNNSGQSGFGPDQSFRYQATYGVAGTRFYGWGGYIQDFIHSRQQNTIVSSTLQTSSTTPVLDPFITTSTNIYMVGRVIYEIDSTGSLNAWGHPSAASAQLTYGRTLPTASTIAGLTVTPQNAQLNWNPIQNESSEINNMKWGMNNFKVTGSKFRVASNYNWQGFAKGTVFNRNSATNPVLLVLGKKISGSSFPTASGAPTNLSFKIFTGSSNNDVPRIAYVEFSSSLDDAEIQVSSSYPNATGSQFVTYIGPSSSRAYISPPSYSINIRHDLRYIKNGIPSPTTASITANYCPGNGAVLAGSCNGSGQFVATTANGACGSGVTNLGCAYTSCSGDYSVNQTYPGDCSDIAYSGYCCGTYYDYYIRDPGGNCYQFISRDVSGCS